MDLPHEVKEQLNQFRSHFEVLRGEIRRVIVGQEEIVEGILIALIAFIGLRRGDAFLIYSLSFYDRFRDLRREEPDCAKRVIIARDHVIDHIRVAIRVDDGNDRNSKPPRLSDGDLFVLGIDNENRVGQSGHVLNA